MTRTSQCSLAVLSAAALSLFALSLAPAPAKADGALAVGVPSDVAKDGFAYGRNVNSPNQAAARQRALELCRTAKDSTDAARRLCTVVQSFHRKCVSVAMDPAAGTPGIGWAIASTQQAAKERALANCRATAGPNRQQFCTTSDVTCDVK
ncbi:MAG: DUF4189 domain-containing protein [Alphaproteobacteria bacterium]|nr:DUF4189 domain-containing protein [Alphaproteobacteria bacterium]